MVNVAIHQRTVQRRLLPNSWYLEMIRAIRARHAQYVAGVGGGGGGGRLLLHITFHTDQPGARNVSGARGLTHSLMADGFRPFGSAEAGRGGSGAADAAAAGGGAALRSGVAPGASRVGGGGGGGEELIVRFAKQGFADTLSVFHSLVESDLLVPSHSTFSISAALLGNATTLLTTCDSRKPLPHWHAVPCKGAIDLSALPWPPQRNRAALAASRAAARGGQRTERAQWRGCGTS